MRYGLTIDNTKPVADVIAEVGKMADGGISLAASSQIFGYDALTLFAAVGQQVPDIELVTAVVPTYPRHPLMLAAQARTVQAILGDRLTLGIGLSHKLVIEGVFGLSFDQPARHMEEYLNVLMPTVRGEQVSYQGETLTGRTMRPLEIEGPAPDVVVAALGPAMLRLAGTLADGTATWMTGLQTIATHTAPTIAAAAEAAGKPAPRVMVSLPVCVTNEVDAAREQAQKTFALYGTLPSYRAMLDREGASGPGDVAIVGDEAAVTKQFAAFEEAGATEFIAAPFGTRQQRDDTFSLVAELSRNS